MDKPAFADLSADEQAEYIRYLITERYPFIDLESVYPIAISGPDSELVDSGTLRLTMKFDYKFEHVCDNGCQYAKDIGMTEHSCGNGCMYEPKNDSDD